MMTHRPSSLQAALERSVGYVFLIGDSVQNHPNPHPCQTGSKTSEGPSITPNARTASITEALFPDACVWSLRWFVSVGPLLMQATFHAHGTQIHILTQAPCLPLNLRESVYF